MSAYEPYVPTPLEKRIDKLIRLVSPRIQANRVINREREHYFRYMSALPTSSRKNSNAQTSGETLRGSREKMQVMWNAINAVDNSGVCTSIVTKFQMYVCGTLRWQSRCGDRAIATQYEDYMKVALGKSLDVTGRNSLRQMAMLDLRSILVKGDVGTNIVRDGKVIQLQGIEADRIGNPYDYSISNNYVRGLELDDAERISAARVFYRDRPSGTYKFEQTIPVKDARGLPRFLFLVNPISYDDYRGVSVFKTAIDNATYIDRIREYELQALMWAASQSGVFHTKSGALPEGLPFDRNPLVDSSGNAIETYQVRPNTVTALGVGEDVAMFQHDRPSPNVLGILEQTIRDISVGTGLSYGLVWDMSGYTGPAVRAISSQDARTIETWQCLLREGKLDPVAMLVLGNAIANGELPYHPQWMKWEWFFPAKSTIDVGRESDANINEIHAGINTGARVAADDGFDIEEIKLQRGREIEAEIQVAMEVAKNLEGGGEQPVDWHEIYQLMCPRPGKGGGFPPGGGGGGFPPGGDGADTGGGNGAATGSRNGSRNGAKTKARMPEPAFVWYSPDQARDDHGRFEDEGGGIATGGVREDTGEKPPKVGEPFLVYRLGAGNPLTNANAGNSVAVATHLMNVDNPEAPQPSGGTGDRVAIYQVTPHQDWGSYHGFIGGKAENERVSRIGRDAENGLVVYSFPKRGKYVSKKIIEVPVKDIRAHLKKIAGTDDFDQAGALAGAKAIREAIKKAHNFRADHIWYREDQERDERGRFADEGKGGAPAFRNEPEAYARAQLEGVAHGKPGITHEPINGQPSVVHRDESGKAIGILRHTGRGAITDVAVLPEHRGKGIGGKLIEAAKGEGARYARGPFTEHGKSLVEHGELDIEGKPGKLDKAIADYKPDRSLSDPAKTTPISKAVPGVSYTPYSQTPFFGEVNVLQGSGDLKGKINPLKHGVADYVEQRKQLFETIPPTKIKLENVVATQETVNTDRVQELADDPTKGGDKPIYVVKKDGKQYIVNGHHRVAGLLVKGEHPEINAHVLDLDHPEPKPATSNDDVRRYTNELEQMPAYRTVVDRLKALGASNGEREGYTVRKNIIPGTEIRDKDGHVVNGTFKPEYEKEHADIVAKNLNPAAAHKDGERKIAVFLIGKPAAGKSESQKKYVDNDPQFAGEKFTTINTDNLREDMSDYRGWNAAATQGEAKIINEQLYAKALQGNHNIIFDEVAGNTTKIVGGKDKDGNDVEGKVQKLIRLGYEVHVVHVEAPLSQTTRIAWDRFKSSGRFVDPEYLLKDADDKPIITYNAIKAIPGVKSWKNVDNEGFKGTLIDEGSR